MLNFILKSCDSRNKFLRAGLQVLDVPQQCSTIEYLGKRVSLYLCPIPWALQARLHWLGMGDFGEDCHQAAAGTECSSLPSPQFQLLWIHSTITKFFIKLLNLFTIQFSISTHNFEAISFSHILSMNRRVLIHGRQWKIYSWWRFPSLGMLARWNIHLLGYLTITVIWPLSLKITSLRLSLWREWFFQYPKKKRRKCGSTCAATRK